MNSLCFEITETAVVDDLDRSVDFINSIKKLGVKFSLDDFGTGYSNLGYLNQLPFSELKIDKIFIDNIVHNKQSKQLLEIIISIAKVRGLKIVAEGVETEEQLRILKEEGCDICQGYYFSRPLPASDFLTWLKEHDN